jgi:transcriptional regulator with XRE-family HTH domain
MAAPMTFGRFFKKMRGKRGLSLRQFCVKNNVDPGNISRLERGLMPPPQSREKLEQHASFLKIRKESPEWFEFFDLAAADSGRIPTDIMRDENLMKKLPLVFQTIRGQKVSKEKLEELAEVIRKA